MLRWGWFVTWGSRLRRCRDVLLAISYIRRLVSQNETRTSERIGVLSTANEKFDIDRLA